MLFSFLSSRIDGRLSESAWRSLPEATGFHVLGGGYSCPKQTYFRISWDKECLYIGIRCEEPDIKKIKPKLRDGEALWGEDGVEIFIIPENTKECFQFVVNTIGSRWNGISSNDTILPLRDWAAKTYRANDFYSVEMRIPFCTLGKIPKPEEQWRGNICRNIYVFDSGGDKHTSWTSLENAFYESRNFANLLFVQQKLTGKKADKIEDTINSAYTKKTKKDLEKIFAECQEFAADLPKLEKTHTLAPKISSLKKELALWEKTLHSAKLSVREMRLGVLKGKKLYNDISELKLKLLIESD